MPEKNSTRLVYSKLWFADSDAIAYVDWQTLEANTIRAAAYAMTPHLLLHNRIKTSQKL